MAAGTSRNPRDAAAEGAGLRLLMPGWPQWRWGQRERGGAFFGGWASALLAGAFAWGTLLGWGLFGFALLIHAASVADALAQGVFPSPPRRARWAGAVCGLALLVYLPAAAAATMFAWPGMRYDDGLEGYLVDCWSYYAHGPATNDWVWYRPAPMRSPRVGRVLAGAGQEVVWSGNQLLVDGRPLAVGAAYRSIRPPAELAYRVPDGHSLVAPGGGRIGRPAIDGVLLVSDDLVVGRAWARMYPVTERQLLQ